MSETEVRCATLIRSVKYNIYASLYPIRERQLSLIKCQVLLMLTFVIKLKSRKIALRKHAYSNILKILPIKKGKFSDKKKSDIFHISAQNIDCGYSLEPPR